MTPEVTLPGLLAGKEVTVGDLRGSLSPGKQVKQKEDVQAVGRAGCMRLPSLGGDGKRPRR